MNIKSFESYHQDRILDKIAKGGLSAISKREKRYLDSLSTGDSEEIEKEFDDRSKHISNILNFDHDEDELLNLSPGELTDTKYHVLWDHINDDDAEEFMKDMDIQEADILDGLDLKLWEDLTSEIKSSFIKWINTIN
jgi:uncharacterized protein YjhX (UPF0386 family)